jgi:hypothetical protein
MGWAESIASLRRKQAAELREHERAVVDMMRNGGNTGVDPATGLPVPVYGVDPETGLPTILGPGVAR